MRLQKHGWSHQTTPSFKRTYMGRNIRGPILRYFSQELQRGQAQHVTPHFCAEPHTPAALLLSLTAAGMLLGEGTAGEQSRPSLSANPF